MENTCCKFCESAKPEELKQCMGCGKTIIIKPSKLNSIAWDIPRLKEVLNKHNKESLDISRNKGILWPTLFMHLNEVDPHRLYELISLYKAAA